MTKTKVIVVIACVSCPYHTSSVYPQLDDGDDIDEHYYAEQHICLKHVCLKSDVDKHYPTLWRTDDSRNRTPLIWWTDDRTPEPPAIQDECPLPDR